MLQQIIVGQHKAPLPMFAELDKSLEDDANKLEIERQAIRNRLSKQLEQQQPFESVSGQLIDTVNSTLDDQLASPQLLLQQSGINETQVLILEVLQHKNADLRRLRTLISDLPWLCRDLTNIVNSPSFRHHGVQRSEVKVSDLKLVLNFIGMENLQSLIPYFCLRNWLPSGQPNLLWTTRKLWRYSILTAIAAKALAQLEQKNNALAYSCGLLHQLGSSVVLKHAAKVFEQVWGSWLKEANHNQEKAVYDAVLATEFPASNVLKQTLVHAHRLNWQLLSLLKFEQSPLTQVQRELDTCLSYSELSEYAALVAQASCYAKMMMLEDMRMITPKEKQLMFDYYELTEQQLIRLQGQNFRKLEIG
nr:HDOD domain-containing protein [Shewanella sp. Isolate11]